MSKKLGVLCVAVAMFLPPSVGMSQQGIRWEPSLDSAQRVASQTNRLVLIYFSGPACPHCRKMEAEVLSQPAVSAAINADYVAVKVVADQFPATARRYRVEFLPTTVITTPQGQMIDSKQGFTAAGEYAARVSGVALEAKRRREAVYAQVSTGPAALVMNQATGNQPLVNQPVAGQPPVNPPTTVQTPPSGQPPFGVPGSNGQAFVNQPVVSQSPANQPPMNQPVMGQPPMISRSMVPDQPAPGQPLATTAVPPGYPSQGYAPPAGPSTADYGQSQRPIPGPPVMNPTAPDGNRVVVGQPGQTNSPLVMVQPPLAPQNNVAPPQASPFCLDGFCPVTLVEKAKWVIGDTRWGATHRGQTYLFVGPEEQRRFFADPDRYAPVASGTDIVMATDQGQVVPGRREHGLFVGKQNQVFLFSSEASLQRFRQNPDGYTNQALQALRAGANQPRQQWR